MSAFSVIGRQGRQATQSQPKATASGSSFHPIHSILLFPVA
jgi:hypothetical protein